MTRHSSITRPIKLLFSINNVVCGLQLVEKSALYAFAVIIYDKLISSIMTQFACRRLQDIYYYKSRILKYVKKIIIYKM
jgi:hypothetical protein